MDYVNLPNSPYKLIDGWLQHKGTHDSKWVQYWCVIKEFTLYIFKNQDTSRENHIGVLQLGSDTKYRTGESDEKKGYRFDLYTTKRLNKFRTTKFSERELWKAFIIGLAQGDVSDGLDLLPGQIHKIRDDIQRVRGKSQNPPLPISSSRMPPDSSSVGTGFSSPDNSITSIFPDNQSHLSLDNGGPMIRHRFWRDPDNSEIPTWFFSGITRDIAEKVLNSGGNYGNTLMRESVTFRDTGSYVITKKMEHARRNPFNHFEVIRIAEGFKINVENAHKSIPCLSEVMDYFVNMSGAAVTRPLITNDVKILGLEAPDYQTRIESKRTNPDSGEEYQEAEDYEEAHVQSSRNMQRRPDVHATWSPQKYFPGNRGAGGGYGGSTVSGYGARNRSSIDPVQLSEGVKVANVMSNLDSTINHYDPYKHGYNRRGRNEIDEVVELGQAPPLPCLRGRRQSQPVLHITADISTQGPDKRSHPRWQSRTKSVPNLGILGDLSYLNKQVPVPSESPTLMSPTQTPHRPLSTIPVPVPSESPTLMSPTQTPHRPLPKPPEQEDTEKSPPMSGFQKQLEDARLKLSGGPNKKVSEGKSVSFANTPSEDGSSESGATNKQGFKERLEMLLAGGPRTTNPVQRTSAVPTSPVSQGPVEEEEEEYDEVLYEHIDGV
ncbi:uncharacterized protein LOC124255826 isoform X2 [Haliotis rubra]|uniref:uncharacterized protein LOC124255826 isoform X2 n=1 Tax=Haliotis rubra TaxID=36100 RepID=UPI001EE5E8E0|nr:uncharacterized protein LOC124255826 isoform X2 [Haliotis rubra]